MELHLGGIAITKIHTTIVEGPQVGPSITRMNANVEPFLVFSFQHIATNSKSCTIKKPTEC